MKPVKSVLVLTIFSSLLLIAGAQPQQPAPTQQVDQDRMEAVHGPLISGKDNAADTSRLTQAVAAVLPETAAAYAPVPRNNFVDEHIFGRIERDKIPHAPVARDEEFLRRA